MRGEEPSGLLCPRWGCRNGWNQLGPRPLQASAALGKVSQVVLGRFSLTGRADAPQVGLGSPPLASQWVYFLFLFSEEHPVAGPEVVRPAALTCPDSKPGFLGFPRCQPCCLAPRPTWLFKLPLLPSLGVLRHCCLWASHGSGHLGLWLARGIDSTKPQFWGSEVYAVIWFGDSAGFKRGVHGTQACPGPFAEREAMLLTSESWGRFRLRPRRHHGS